MTRIASSCVLFFLTLNLILVGGCCPESSKDSGDSRPVVYASFYPLYDFAQKIGGDKICVKCLIKPGVKAHDWEPAPRDLADLSKADLFLCNGLGMEPWIQNVVEALGDTQLNVVEVANGIEPIQGCGCTHHHHEGETEHGEHDGHEEHDRHEHDSADAYSAPDPHVWLSPVNVKIILKNIANAFCKLDPNNTEYFKANLDTWSKKCDELDTQFRDALSKTEHKEIVVSHQAFGYLCREYGLSQIPIEGLTAQSDPGMARMAELVKKIRNSKIHIIYVESSQDCRVCDALAKETGAEVKLLNPYETLYDDQIQAGDEYFSIMKRNLDVLR